MRHWQKPQIRKFYAKKSPPFTANHIPATSGQWKEKSIFVQKKTELEVLLVFKAKSVVHFLWLMQLFEHKSFHNMTPVETLWDDIVKDCFCWWFSDDSGNRREKVRGNSVPGISWHRIYFQSSDFQLGQGNLLTLQICQIFCYLIKLPEKKSGEHCKIAKIVIRRCRSGRKATKMWTFCLRPWIRWENNRTVLPPLVSMNGSVFICQWRICVKVLCSVSDV